MRRPDNINGLSPPLQIVRRSTTVSTGAQGIQLDAMKVVVVFEAELLDCLGSVKSRGRIGRDSVFRSARR
jgi:hypothetical protein